MLAMAPLQIVLNDRAKQTKLNEEAEETTEPYRNPFGDGDSSDSDSEKPKVRQISHLSAARPQPPPQKPSQPPLPEPEKKGAKGSQIARLVERRKDAAAGLGEKSREAREGALFKYDVNRCEDEASVEGYAKRPVEGFGELMLRGMGWRGTADKGDTKDPSPRPARLGLGAKVESALPGLPRKRPRVKDSGVQEGPSGEKNTLREHSGRDAAGGVTDRSDMRTRAGVTAENWEKTGVGHHSRDRFVSHQKKVNGSGSQGERRRKRSRFTDDPGR